MDKSYKYSTGHYLIEVIVLSFMLAMLLFALKANSHSIKSVIILLLLMSLMIFIGLMALVQYPNLRVNDDFLYVQFFFKYIPVPWEEIIGVVHFASLIKLHRTQVYVKKLNIFFYDFIGYKDFNQPSFFIRFSISDYEELLRIIESKATKAYVEKPNF